MLSWLQRSTIGKAMPRQLMDHDQVLPLYHPTSVLLVGDDVDCLHAMTLRLQRQFQCFACRTPREAIAIVRSQGPAVPPGLFDGAIGPPGTLEYIRDPDQRALHLEASRLPRVFADASRFSRTSVIVAGHSQPALAMLAELGDLPLRKLVVSDAAEEAMAAPALRDGLIDAICCKRDEAFHVTLAAQLHRLQRAYFRDLTSPFAAALSRADTRFLLAPALQAAFDVFAAEHAIIEYCACMHPPGILGLDDDGNPAMLILVDDDYRQAAFEIAHAERAPTALLQRLAHGNSIAVFPTDTGFYAQGLAIDWRDCLAPSRPLGEHGLRYAVVDEPEVIGKVCGAVASYASYRGRALS